jgi:predicted TIM-barrel fold metal-dependent hydrolase
MSGNFEIIDCHVHPFLSSETNTEWFCDSKTPDDFVEILKRSGISRACGSVVKRLEICNFSEIRELNKEALDFRDRYPDFFIPGIHIHPDFPEESCEELERLYKEENVRWVGELVAYMMSLGEYLPKKAYPIYELARDLNVPVNIHSGPEDVAKICENIPGINVVLAHPSAGKGTIEERVELCAKYPGAHLDISGSGIQRWGLLRFGIDKAGKEKFLFGTDFPISNPASFVQGALFEELTDEEFVAVMSGNFKRLTGLE